jgi:hypothetical protein
MSLDSNTTSSDITNIKVSSDFLSNYQLGGIDAKILESAIQHNNGQTDYQAQHFVANSQITPYKKVRQALMELEVRHHAYIEIKTSLRKAEVYARKMGRDIKAYQEMGDDISADLVEIDRDKNEYDITIWKRKLYQAEREIQSFLEIVKFYAPDEESLKYYTEENEMEERNYWILRMGKQAALDIIAFGRVGSGNMDSLAMMSKDEQVEALTIAIQYSGLINANISEISERVQEGIQQAIDANELDVPMIEDGLEVDVHGSIESKVNGERLSEIPAVPAEA